MRSFISWRHKGEQSNDPQSEKPGRAALLQSWSIQLTFSSKGMKFAIQNEHKRQTEYMKAKYWPMMMGELFACIERTDNQGNGTQKMADIEAGKSLDLSSLIKRHYHCRDVLF